MTVVLLVLLVRPSWEELVLASLVIQFGVSVGIVLVLTPLSAPLSISHKIMTCKWRTTFSNWIQYKNFLKWIHQIYKIGSEILLILMKSFCNPKPCLRSQNLSFNFDCLRCKSVSESQTRYPWQNFFEMLEQVRESHLVPLLFWYANIAYCKAIHQLPHRPSVLSE